jgi:hypothetical protein
MIPDIMDKSILLPFIRKINITPNTDKEMDSFCHRVVTSFIKIEAITIVTTGVKELIIPPSAEVACCNPNTWSVKKPRGYVNASKNN